MHVKEMLYSSLKLLLLFIKYNDYFSHDVYCHKVLMKNCGSNSYRLFQKEKRRSSLDFKQFFFFFPSSRLHWPHLSWHNPYVLELFFRRSKVFVFCFFTFFSSSRIGSPTLFFKPFYDKVFPKE